MPVVSYLQTVVRAMRSQLHLVTIRGRGLWRTDRVQPI